MESEAEEEVTDEEAMEEDEEEEEVDEEEEEDEEEDVVKYATKSDAYSLCVKYKLSGFAASFGLTPELFGENLKDNYMKNETKQVRYLQGYTCILSSCDPSRIS